VIHEGDMELGFGKSPFFDGTNYPYWNIRMSAHLRSISSWGWEICEVGSYVVLATRITQEQIEQHDANSKARNALFSCISPSEFDRVSHLATAQEIWDTLQRYHEGTSQVKTRLFGMYRHEYKNFSQLPGESRFQSIVNKMWANKPQLPYDDHERARKLLHALD
jgi:hypothetical protein